MSEKPPLNVALIWEHDLVFAGTSGNVQMTLDSAAAAGPSPMQALAFASLVSGRKPIPAQTPVTEFVK